ncbi:D-alanyl-D-alanine carboxypeptidase family protein [Bradyrhizobium sp. CCGB20]|uniref:D-alanyl-D-alanine carboxypeptidase family protein n=1 Tax=Bradyrhizobium sp. CCGB20 TaxID=2949633 RepID=UPI0020B25D1A|nr:D-alanyl-D-alanine carboxypeptidase family protein [Bradyrhizobium sp. CCGB20]MCP3400404.1 D-alanyl-D-alanine carboxypeptidase family protein [Bradyrhizobium sp. CCGB20]
MDELMMDGWAPEGVAVPPATPVVQPDLPQPEVQPAPSPAPQPDAVVTAPEVDPALAKGLEQQPVVAQPDAPKAANEQQAMPVVTTSVQALTPYLAPGKDISHINGMQDTLAERLTRLISEAPQEIRDGLKINSGFRSVGRQAQIYKEAVAKYGSEAEARKWAAPPGRSNHNHGYAADLGYGNPAVSKYVHDNAARYGLAFPMAHEPWHIETAEARSGVKPVTVPSDIKGYIEDAAQRAGVPANVLMNVAKQESDFGRNTANPKGSAKGLFQFVDGTWSDMITKSGPIYGLATTTPVTDNRANAFMAAEYMRQNNALFTKQMGRAPKDGEMYISHFMGGQGGVNFVKAYESQPTANAASLFPKEASYNRNIFYEKNGTPLSVAQVYSRLSAMGEGNTKYADAPGIDFGAQRTPQDFKPAPAAATQGEIMSANEQMAKREREMPWYQTTADAISQSSITARLLQNNPHFTPDASFVMTPELQTTLQKQYGLAPEMMPRFESAVSANHATYIAEQAQRDQVAQQHLSDAGWTGTALQLATTLLDPVSLGVGVASGGLGDLAAVTIGAGRVGRVAMQAGAGAAANVGLELGERRLNMSGEDSSLLMTAAVGAMFGGSYGLISRNPATLAEAQKMANLGQSMKQQLEGTSSHTSPNSMGAAGNPNANMPFLNDKAFIATQDADAPYTVDKIAGVKVGRSDAVGQLKTTKDANTRLIGGALGEDGVANADGRINTFSASEEMELFHRKDIAQLNQMWAPAASEWAKDNGYKLGRLTGGAEFNDLVTSFIRNTDPTLDWHPAVKRLGDHIARMNEEKLLDAQNPLRREGLVGRPVKGFEETPTNKNYMMRIYDAHKINQLLDEAVAHGVGQRGLEAWFKGAMKSAQTWMDDEILDKIAEGTVKRLRNKANGIDEAMNLMHSGFDVEHLKDILRDVDVPEERIDKLLGTVRLNAETGADARAKHRLLLDETFTLRGYRTFDGSTRDLALSDFTVTDAKLLSDMYFRHMNGRIALARVRVQNPTTGEMLINGITSDNEWATVKNQLVKSMADSKMTPAEIKKATANLDFLYDRTLGRPDPAQQGEWASWLRRVRKFNFLRQGGSFGMAQIPEMAMIPAQLGMKAFLQHVPAFKRIVTADGRSILNDGLAAELEAAFGVGTDRLRGMQFFKSDEFGFHETGKLGKLDNGLDFAQMAVAEASGMTTINTMLQRTTAKVIAQKFADMALDPTSVNLKRMASIGLSDKMLKRITQEVNTHFTKEDGLLFSGKVTRMNLDKWTDLEARAAFENALFRWSRRIIQENDIGNMHRWSSGPLWQMLFQFRTFSINAWNKQFMLNMHMRDMTSFHVMTYSLLAGAAAYAARMQLQAIGRSDKEDFLAKRLSPEKMALGAFQNTGWSSLLPMATDTAAYLTGNSPVFDARTSGNASDVIFGSPTIGLMDDFAKAAKGVVQPIKDGRQRSQMESRQIARVAPFQNWMPASALLSTMISSQPERPAK